MSLGEIREQNKQLVAEKALELYLENGIEKTSICDIARAAGLTERSVYRYFETRIDIVIAAAYIFWDRTTHDVEAYTEKRSLARLSGLDRIRILLGYYSRMYFENPDGVRFILDAEMTLYKAGVSDAVKNRPPVRFAKSKSPLATAIRDGLADGSVKPRVDPKELYYSAYDSILGTMERLALGTPGATDVNNRKRMQDLCDMYIRAFAGEDS